MAHGGFIINLGNPYPWTTGDVANSVERTAANHPLESCAPSVAAASRSETATSGRTYSYLASIAVEKLRAPMRLQLCLSDVLLSSSFLFGRGE